ncbi:ribonuclease M5 [Salibacterium qingdaonense]|uniref:Ribonuclease M5 n=1 Tax=Salibacterium qingdaonense TaxID=266892 RepID=A0A1I4QKZ5_9BACI|nr:ribonuclease M5 [Salibacterium qingdaonense]SFM40355.1 RNAse M5 [Salibacterium qingdaonense]
MNVKECIVVEGKADTMAVKRAVEADTIETNGAAVGEDVLKRIALASERRGVIIFTDPDVPGERIRRIVSREVPGCRHAFLTKADADSGGDGSLGVEHAPPEVIRRALQSVRNEMPRTAEKTEPVTRQDLLDAGMMAGADSRRRREKMGEKLNIGYSNAKQFLHRLHVFNIQRAEFARAAAAVLEEEERIGKRHSSPGTDERNT